MFVTILRWTVGVVAGSLVATVLFGFVISVVFDNDLWRGRTRRLRAWLGVVAGLLVAAVLFGFTISVVFDNDIWRERTRRLRAWLGVIALAWFNGEVWGRVVYTLDHWSG